MPDFVPPVPVDWATKEAEGTPYTLRVVGGEVVWVAAVALPIVQDQHHHAVTVNGRPVFLA